MSEQNSLFEKFFMYSLDGVLLSRPDGTILRANPAACRVLERTEQEICRVGRAGLAVNDDHLRDVLSQKQASASAAGELSFRRPDGSVFPVEFSSVLMPDGDSAPFSYVVFRDITEQRRLEDAHRRTNRALRLLTRCNQALARATTEEALFTEVCKVMVEGGGYRMCWVGLAENDVHKTVRPVAHAGSEDGYLATADIVWSDTPNGQGPTGTAMRTGRPVVGRDFANDPILKPWRQEALRHGYRSSISLPLALEGQQIGVITMYSAECEVFDDEELSILVQLSTDLAYGILALRERAARVRADDALRRSETMLKRITDAIPEPIFLKDREGRWIFANPATLEVLGKPRDLVLGKTDQEIHANPGIAQALVETDRRIMESGEAEVVEEIVEGRDGQRLFLSSKAPLRDLDGRVIGIVGSARDITDRKHVDEALRERDYLLSESQRIAHIGTWSWELPSNALRWSDEAYRIYGVTPESFALNPQSFLHFLHPDDLPAMQAWTRSCSSQQRPGELAFRIVRLDGTVRVLEGRGELIDAKDHRSAHMTGTVQDVTERKQVEADRERLTAAIEQAAETVVVSDVQGNIVYVNPAFEALTGYTRAEVLGHNPRILKSGVHDEAFYGALWATISSGKNWHGRLVNKKKDGTHFTEDATISPVRDATGVITSYVAVKRDISRDLALEAQLRQSQKMDSVGRLAGGVAHDFNNILSVILGCAEFALEDLPQGDRSRDDILEIEKAAKRAAALTRQLLAFSRKQVLRPVPLDLNGVLVDMKKMLQRLLGEDIDLVQLLSPNLGLVKADPGQIEQVVMNLAVNARDAMPDGGKLTIETANVELDEESTSQHEGAAPGPHAMIAVSDSGVGMDKKTMARLFEPFFTTKGLGKGTGLGLATVYGIVKQSGGSIYVYSEQGVGTTFKVHLPLESSSMPVVDGLHAVERSGGTETILIVEDDEAVRSVAKRILEGAGYIVLTATNGRDALRTCERNPAEIHLVLTDVVMPEMGGKVFIEHLAQVRRGFKVLYMSGYTDDAIVHHGILDQGTHLIGKPLTRVELLQTVRDVLDG